MLAAVITLSLLSTHQHVSSSLLGFFPSSPASFLNPPTPPSSTPPPTVPLCSPPSLFLHRMPSVVPVAPVDVAGVTLSQPDGCSVGGVESEQRKGWGVCPIHSLLLHTLLKGETCTVPSCVCHPQAPDNYCTNLLGSLSWTAAFSPFSWLWKIKCLSDAWKYLQKGYKHK